MNNYKLLGPNGAPIGVVSINEEAAKELEEFCGLFDISYSYNFSTNKLKDFKIFINPENAGDPTDHA